MSIVAATVTHDVAPKPVCQVPDVWTTTHPKGPATAMERNSQNIASRDGADRKSACTDAGSNEAKAETLRSTLFIAYSLRRPGLVSIEVGTGTPLPSLRFSLLASPPRPFRVSWVHG
jgi:hypothetical protein